MLGSIIMRNLPPYDDKGIVIEDLRKVNFIYGINGSGKTTITKFLADPGNPVFSACSMEWNGTPLQMLIYNKDFREKNFGKGNLPGVFTLGAATKEEHEAIERLKNDCNEKEMEITKKKAAIERQQQLLQECEQEATERFWLDIYKKFEPNFKEAFQGSMNSKQNFKQRLLQEFKSNSGALLTQEELLKRAKTIFGERPQNLPVLPLIPNTQTIEETESHMIWNKKILGKADVPIGALIQRLNINDWVNTGRQFIQDNDEVCPFCQEQTISVDLKKQLEDYFDKSFLNDTSLVNTLANSYRSEFQTIINLLESIHSTEKVNPKTKLELELFFATLKTLQMKFISNEQTLRSKAKEPSRSVELISTKEQLNHLQQYIADANSAIANHNRIAANYVSERNALINAVWKYVIETFRPEIERYQKKADGLSIGIMKLEQDRKALADDLKVLDLEIKNRTRNLTSVQPSIDEINRTLKAYGFLNFQIVPSPSGENQYQVQRQDGEIAEPTLSEGETTFITFLYFFQLCKGSTDKDQIKSNRILVIDDPISSLDSNVLFIVSSLIKEITKSIKSGQGQIKQVIVLTHNVYFHKEVSYIEQTNTPGQKAYFWMLRKKASVSTIEAFRTKNPIQNSYELLWQEIRTEKENSLVTIQNTMRRIVENYFKILGNYSYDDLISRFPNQEEKEICRSMLCWINDGSHCFPDDLYIEHQDDQVERYKKVFRDIFVHTNHLGHYNMMMQIDAKEAAVIDEDAS